MRSKYLIFFTAIILLGALFFSSCQEKSEPESELRFTYIGDVHYEYPDYDVSKYFVPKAAEELSQLEPKSEFVLLTGDFCSGNNKDKDLDAEEAEFAYDHFSKTIGMPFYIAIGNHDLKDDFTKNALPIFSDQQNREIDSFYYSMDQGNSHFIFLDCMEKDFTQQLEWLENDLKEASANPEIEHIFAASHYPLWIVARAGFTNPDFADPVSKLLAKYKIDAMFVGHTHNHSTTVKMVDGFPLTQIMGAGVAKEGRLFNLAPFLDHVTEKPENLHRPGLLALEEAHNIFIDPSDLKYYWGYQEGSTSSYSVVTIKGKTVQVDYHVLGSGIVRSYKWDKPGEIVDLIAPEEPQKEAVTEGDIATVKKAWLYAAPWTMSDSVTAPISINGISAGTLDMGRGAVAYSPFWNKVEVPLDDSIIAGLKLDNSLQISNPDAWEFGLAHIFILVQFEDGRFAKSTISPSVLTSYQSTERGNYIPDPALIHWVPKGEDLERVELRFEHVYESDINQIH